VKTSTPARETICSALRMDAAICVGIVSSPIRAAALSGLSLRRDQTRSPDIFTVPEMVVFATTAFNLLRNTLQ